ncbi:hypothetical protein IMZ48_20310 [Candidatus Bathyarchaeota archaeon]|nr:hypothetical protein [Candidatus Bathyarchaeota archaeon]
MPPKKKAPVKREPADASPGSAPAPAEKRPKVSDPVGDTSAPPRMPLYSRTLFDPSIQFRKLGVHSGPHLKKLPVPCLSCLKAQCESNAVFCEGDGSKF